MTTSEELVHGALGFADRVAMIHRSGQIGVRKRDAPMRRIAQDVARGGLAARAEEKAGLGIHVGMSPPVEDDPGDVAPWVEPARSEHVAELRAESPLVLREGRAEQVCSAAAPLFADGQAGAGE